MMPINIKYAAFDRVILPAINCKHHRDTAASDLRRLNNQRCRISAHDRQLLARDATALHRSAAVKPLAGRFTNMRVGEGGGGCSGLSAGG